MQLTEETTGEWTVTLSMLSFLPDLGSVAVHILTSAVYLARTGVVAVGTVLGFGSTAMEGVGRCLKRASAVLPRVVSVLVVAGFSLVLLFPGVYDWILSTIASVGVAMAGHVTAAVRSLMDEHSPWATILDTTTVFIRKLQQDF